MLIGMRSGALAKGTLKDRRNNLRNVIHTAAILTDVDLCGEQF